jgi:hypothetical protein
MPKRSEKEMRGCVHGGEFPGTDATRTKGVFL